MNYYCSNKNEYPWYVAGLHFQCMGCGNCCSGPEEGYIWVTRKEISMLAEKLGLEVKDFEKKFTRKVGTRTTLIEEAHSKDCIFLCDINGSRGCEVYSCRPNQCRTWPFWDFNLDSPDLWNSAGTKCPGINQGRLYTYEEIEKLRKQKKWWEDESKKSDS